MARSKTFGAPQESVVIRIQATKKGRVTGTQSYRVVGGSLEDVCNVLERALEAEFGGGTAGNDDDEASEHDRGDESEPISMSTSRPDDGKDTTTFAGRPDGIGDVITAARDISSEAEFEIFMSRMRHLAPAPSRKSVGAFTGRAVADFQNWLYDENVSWRLTDLQLLAVMRTEFPLNEGQVFTGDVQTGLGHIASIRADYNRTGHGGSPPAARGSPPSVSYGRIHVDDG